MERDATKRNSVTRMPNGEDEC